MGKPSSTHFVYATACGPVTIGTDGTAIVGAVFGRAQLPGTFAASELTNRAANQLHEYLAGKRTAFDLPLSPAGSPFQQAVWHAVGNVPYGQTRTCAEIAAVVGRPQSARAVGQALNRCPLAVFVPTHRIVGATGKPTGPNAGIAVRLLALERANG